MVVHIHTDGSLARGLDPPTNVFINIPLCPAIIIIGIIIAIIIGIIILIIVMKPQKSDLALTKLAMKIYNFYSDGDLLKL